MKSEDYKAIQDLEGVKIEIGSFDEDIFNETKHSYNGSVEKRTCKLYTSDVYDVLHFSYSSGGNKELYIHFKERPPYKDGIYLEIPKTGMSSCGNKKHTSGHNPWTKYVKDIEVFIEGNKMLLHTGTTDFSFLTEVEDDEIIYEERQRGYAKLPENVETIRYMCKSKTTPEVWCVTYSTFGFRYGDVKLRILNINTGEVSVPKITDFRTYRDGGTTYIDYELHGKKETMFYPTTLGGAKGLNPKIFEDEDVTKAQLTFGVDEGLYNFTVKRLGIILEVVNDYKYVPNPISTHEEYDLS